jgi:List-Bact-rpt repeat protein
MVMKRLRCFSLFVLTICAIGMNSCAHDQELVSIAIQPSSETFGAANIPVSANAGLNVQLRALGTYIHPPVTKDITNQVTWSSNDTQMLTVDSSGLLTATGLTCGSSLISATVTTNHSSGGRSSSGAIVTGSITANVVCFGSGSGNGGPLLTVNFTGSGSGTVTSSPAGLGCATSCSTNFPNGTAVTLTAAPNSGSTFGNWVGCDSVNGQSCALILTTNRTVTVTFN